MASVRLPFRPEWRARVLDGSKTTTVRTRRFGAPDDEFAVDGRRFRLVAVEPASLARARDACFATEGFASPGEFEADWAAHHPARGFRASDAVWIHRFVPARAPREDEPA